MPEFDGELMLQLSLRSSGKGVIGQSPHVAAATAVLGKRKTAVARELGQASVFFSRLEPEPVGLNA